MATVNFTRTIKVSLTADSGTLSGPAITRIGDAAADLSETVPAGATNKEYDIAFDADRQKLYMLLATADCTLYTNAPSTGSPGSTIALKAGVPVWYADQAGMTNVFTVDVTKIYVTSTSVKDFQIDIRTLQQIAV